MIEIRGNETIDERPPLKQLRRYQLKELCVKYKIKTPPDAEATKDVLITLLNAHQITIKLGMKPEEPVVEVVDLKDKSIFELKAMGKEYGLAFDKTAKKDEVLTKLKAAMNG